LDEHVVVPRGMLYTGPTDYMLATAMDAILGAIDIDSGEDAGAVRDAMVKIGLTAASPDLVTRAQHAAQFFE
jgi:hypothetical protein